MAFWKKKASAGSNQNQANEVPSPSDEISVKTFTAAVASDIQDDSMTLEIYRGESFSSPSAEMAVTLLWDETYEIYPPTGSRTYTCEEVTELLELVVQFVIERARGNVIDRVAYPQYHKSEYQAQREKKAMPEE